ncbi:hypothetical protein BC938DRAFT_472286 [Jimgerdemannia flammicorona]|nr:hypothetical protein BC938DRAFT_472286 [Jimgerdemannia flammicorona]
MSTPANQQKPVTPQNQSTAEKVASPLVALSSRTDPYPHFFMSGACAIGSYYAYNAMKNNQLALIAGGIAAAYAYAGYLLGRGDEQLGYNLATATSLALVAATGPKALQAKDPFNVSMASLGGLSSLGNFVKAYQQRTGKPAEIRTSGK